MSTPVVNLVESVVLRVSLLNLASVGAQKDHVNTVASTALAAARHLEVTLPVEGEAVAAVGNRALDESTGIIGLFSVALDKLIEVVEDGRKVVVLWCLNKYDILTGEKQEVLTLAYLSIFLEDEVHQTDCE